MSPVRWSQYTRRLPWLVLALSGIGLGTAGAFLPLLPTTPFLLVAAWAAPKGSPALDQWLHDHPRLGPPLLAWRARRAVPRRAKRLTPVLLLISLLVMALAGVPTLVLALMAVFFSALTIYLFRRPDA